MGSKIKILPMKNEILKQIEEIAKVDDRTLYERCLKASEELGELSRAALSTESEQEQGYRKELGGKQALLEESIDVLFVLYSIIYDTGCSDEELENLAREKLAKWRGRVVKK